MSQRNYSWLFSSISTVSTYTIYSRGSSATPTLSAFAIPAWSLLLLLTRRCLQKGACHEWMQERCVKTWLLAESPENMYRLSVFRIMHLIVKLLWLPPLLLPCWRRSFDCPRSKREKHGYCLVINCCLPNLPSANQREGSGPVAVRWVCHMTSHIIFLWICHPAEMPCLKCVSCNSITSCSVEKVKLNLTCEL